VGKAQRTPAQQAKHVRIIAKRKEKRKEAERLRAGGAPAVQVNKMNINDPREEPMAEETEAVTPETPPHPNVHPDVEAMGLEQRIIHAARNTNKVIATANDQTLQAMEHLLKANQENTQCLLAALGVLTQAVKAGPVADAQRAADEAAAVALKTEANKRAALCQTAKKTAVQAKKWAGASESEQLAMYHRHLHLVFDDAELVVQPLDLNVPADEEEEDMEVDEGVSAGKAPLFPSAAPVGAKVCAVTGGPAGQGKPLVRAGHYPMPHAFDGRTPPGGASPENWLTQTTQYMGLQGHAATEFGLYLSGAALQWWATLTKRASRDGEEVTLPYVQTEFLKHYGDPLKFEPDWARDQLHAGGWHWQPGRELFAAYNLRVRELFTHAGEMQEADQVAWYLTGLKNAPHMRAKCNRDKGQTWGGLDALIAFAVQEDLAYRASRKSDKPVAVRVAAMRAPPQGKRPHHGGGGGGPHKKARSGAGPSSVVNAYELARSNNLCRHCHKVWDPKQPHSSRNEKGEMSKCKNVCYLRGCNRDCPVCKALLQAGEPNGINPN
jgi:hypothetical protein